MSTQTERKRNKNKANSHLLKISIRHTERNARCGGGGEEVLFGFAIVAVFGAGKQIHPTEDGVVWEISA